MNSEPPFFEITSTDKNSHARTGVLTTSHGVVHTPAFMPVGTQATVKTLDVRDLHESNAEIILGNTYHLHLRPGEDLIAVFGGLHQFMGWNRPILTDSGGFQVFSLGRRSSSSRGFSEGSRQDQEGAEIVGDPSQEVQDDTSSLVSIDNDGVTFRSHIDGSKHRFTPESAIITQKKIGADIIMAFDECTPDAMPIDLARDAMKRTHEWAIRCVEAMRAKGSHPWSQALFGIIQGGNHQTLREESAKFISSLPFDGIAIGGESIGYQMDTTEEILNWVRPLIPEEKPRYTMGVGSSPVDLLRVVALGVDMFDCVAPTRMARNGALFCKEVGATKKNRVAITNAQFIDDVGPICSWCTCRYCKGTDNEPPLSRRYIHHLFKAEEFLGLRIASYHNTHFIQQFMRLMRESIASGRFSEFQDEWRQSTSS